MARKKEVKELELGVSIPKPDLKWEAGIFSMRKLLESFRLPCVIRCDPSHFDISSENVTFNMAQPMLLYRQRTIQKLVAGNITYDKSQGKYVNIGDQLLIPQDYKGWFAYFGNPVAITTDPGIPVYTTIQNTANSGATKFLIGGTEKIVGLQMLSSKLEQQQRPDSRTVFPGDVFKVAGTYVATTKYTKKRVFKDKIMSREEKFLLCIDERDREVLLPFEAKGQFHVITSSKNNVQVPIVQLQEIDRFPCVLKLVYGRSPSTPCSFTGILLLTDSFEEESVVSSTVFNVRNILLEIPVETVLKYNVAETDQELMRNKGYREAMLLCNDRSEIYMRQMKVSIAMPEISDDFSMYSGPEHLPPLPPTRNCKSSTPVTPTDYERVHLPKPKSTSHIEMLSQNVPIQSSSNVTLCFGNNAFSIPVAQDGSIRMNPTKKFRSKHPLVEQMYLTPQYDVPNLSPSCSFRGSLSPGSITEENTNNSVDYENVTLLRKVHKSEIADLPPPIPCRAPMFRINNEAFRTSPFDNLHLGATAFSTSFDTQSIADSGVGGDDAELATQSADDLQEALKQYGIKKDTLSALKAHNIDGKVLSKMNIESLQESFPSVRTLEVRKIALFIESKGQVL